MRKLEALSYDLPKWLGLSDVPKFENGPIVLTFEGGVSISLTGDLVHDHLLLTTAAPDNHPLTSDSIDFLLGLNAPNKNPSGIVVGAEADTGTVTLSRRFDPEACNQQSFTQCITTLAIANGKIGSPQEITALETQLIRSLTCHQSPSSRFETLVEQLRGTAFALTVHENGIGTVNLPDFQIVAEIIGTEARVSVIGAATVQQPEQAKQMLFRNLFLAACESNGYFIDDFGRPGCFAFFTCDDNVKTAFEAAALSALRDLTAVAANFATDQTAWAGHLTDAPLIKA